MHITCRSSMNTSPAAAPCHVIASVTVVAVPAVTRYRPLFAPASTTLTVDHSAPVQSVTLAVVIVVSPPDTLTPVIARRSPTTPSPPIRTAAYIMAPPGLRGSSR